MRLHGDRQPHHPVRRKDGTEVLDSGYYNEVWSYGETAYPILTAYMQRREELRPYLRRVMQQAHEEGTPIMRAMQYEFPADENCAELKDQYMFGDKYLVAPVMEPGARSRSVYFPANTTWRNVETGVIYLASEIPDGVAATYEAYYE
jgi:alpha-D-xyloside xylohydrolase